MNSHRLLCNYESSRSSYNPTLMEAIKATSAMPGVFESVHFGPEGQQEEFVSGAIRFNNPTWMAIEEAQIVFGYPRPVSCLLSIGSGIVPPVSLRKEETDITKLIQQIRMDSQTTAELVSKRIGDLKVYFRFSVDHGLENQMTGLGDVTSHTLAYIQTKRISDELDKCLTTTGRPSRVTIGKVCTYVIKLHPQKLTFCSSWSPISKATAHQRVTKTIGILPSTRWPMDKA